MIDQYTDKINKGLSKMARDIEHTELKHMLQEAVQAGGKRIRPALCLMACEMFKSDLDLAMPQAIALELFHTFSLVHDDIMDEAPVRRGQPSVYFKHGRDKAILGGDVVLIMAFSELLNELDQDQTKRVLACFTDIAIKVCEGQMMDMDFEGREFPSRETYMTMIELKTSVLIGAALKIGAIVGGANETICDQLYKFGVLQGLAFQIQDDILDVFGDPSLTGKQNGGDIIQGKKTLLTILCAEQAYVESELFDDVFFADLSNNEKIAIVTMWYDKYKVRDKANALKESFVKRANDILSAMDIDEMSKKKLQLLSDWLMNRSY